MASKEVLRMCVCCRRMLDRRELLRLSRSAEGQWRIADEARRSGRGAYLCTDSGCFERLHKPKERRRILPGLTDAEAERFLPELGIALDKLRAEKDGASETKASHERRRIVAAGKSAAPKLDGLSARRDALDESDHEA